MSKIATLKKKASDLEAKKQPDKAIAVYVELLAAMEAAPEELDVAMFNRAGDLMLKQGSVAEAVDCYEKAVDHYAEGGFFNNAIALCNKILRSSPGRASVYYKLGKISAHKGFKADAKTNFLEYADRMQKAGNITEAFRALTEFADLCPDQTDIRLMLADQLSKAGKQSEAVEQLQILHEQLEAEGRTAEATAAAERLRAIDPTIEPRSGGGGGGARAPSKGGDDLVFLDLGDSPVSQQRRSVAKRATMGLKVIADPTEAPKKPAAAPAPPPAAAKEIEVQKAPPPVAIAPPKAPPKAAPAPVPEPEPEPEPVDSGSLLELESTSLGDSSMIDTSGMLEIESTALSEPEPVIEEPAEIETSSGGDLEFLMPDEPAPAKATPTADLPMLDGTLDLDTPAPPPKKPAAKRESIIEQAPELSLVDMSLDDLSIPESAIADADVKTVAALQSVVKADPENWGAHRQLGEAMLEEGNREGGLRELESAMAGYEKANDLSSAMSVADEIVRLDPSSVKLHQKRVEFAYRTNARPQLVEAYLALADALFRSGQADKSRSIYQRVIELAPDDIRAQAALSTMPEPTPAASKPAIGAKPTPPSPSKTAERKTPVADDSFVNLGDWLREDDAPKDTRMVVAEQEPTGNEQADFADMLKAFKAGVAENVEAEDYQSHYDLGVAYKEMGLVDEAISEFQKALRGPENRVRTYEAIGQCFVEKGQHSMAATILSRALSEKGQTDDQLVGVLYLLGRANEEMGKGEQALAFYQRVFVVDIQFQDVADRLNTLENAPR